jgi:hypothetical protein
MMAMAQCGLERLLAASAHGATEQQQYVLQRTADLVESQIST